MIETINPYTQKSISTYNFLSDQELDHTLQSVQKVYPNWKNTTIQERQGYANSLQQIIKDQTNNLATLISLEMGKPISEAIREINKCLLLIEYVTDNTAFFLKKTILDDNAYIEYQPTGTVFGIMPWNFPFWQVFRFAFSNIMLGNTCVLKHAPNVTGSALKLESLFTEAGFPESIFKTLVIDIPQVETVVAHNTVQGVCITGSTKAGSAVGALAGKYLKKSVLELGGTDAFIVLKNASIKEALNTAFDARMGNAGQVCIAPKRIYVPQEILDHCVDFFKEKINSLVIGDPLEEKTTMGPIAKASFLPILEQQVKSCISHGAKLIVGGKNIAPFFEPTLLVVQADNPILEEEIFGPVLSLIPYDNEELLIQNVNNSPYGLGASLWCQDIEKAKEMASKIEAGNVTINQRMSSDIKYPFGGIKNSGYGKELGIEGYRAFLNAKTVVTA